MAPASLYSYFDAQLADLIMNGQLPAYDDSAPAAAPSDFAGNHISTLTASFAGASDDYDGYENARARKRRMTVSGRPRPGELPALHMPAMGSSSGSAEAANDGLFGMFDQHAAGYARAHPADAGPQTLSSLPVPPGSEPAPLAGPLPFGGAGFAQPMGMFGGSGDSDAVFTPLALPPTHNPLSPLALGRAGGRKPQTLSIAVRHDGANEPGFHEPPTPGMFSPSFMDAMEGAAAAAAAAAASASSPHGLYDITSPFPPTPSHHHSFSIPSAVPHAQSMGLFGSGPLVGPFGSEAHDHGSSAPQPSAFPPGRAAIGGMDDFSAGLNISMNAVAAAAVAAMGGPYDSGVHHRSSSSASAFSRVHPGSDDVSQLLYASSSAAQQPSGLGIDIGTTFASFANIPGLDQFSPSSLSLHGPLGHARFSSATSSAGLMVSSPVMTTGMAEYQTGSPHAAHAHAMRSPAAVPKRSRKRAATVADIPSECGPLPGRLEQRAVTSTALTPAMSGSGSSSSSSSSMVALHAAGDAGIHAGRAFNRQAIVTGTGSKVAVVLTSKVAQKSYGTEKRFLCPPPTILLFGDEWSLPVPGAADDDSARSAEYVASMPRISVSVPTTDGTDLGGEPGSSRASLPSDTQTQQLEWLAMPDPTPKPKAHVPPPPSAQPRMPREDDSVTGRFVAKQLYINDVDEKRKRVSVKVRLHDPTGRVVLNEFESRPIKVISKPSKKRQSVKNVDLCIHHGSTISLFNRLRSQTVSTKYLGASRSMSVGGPRPSWFPAGPTKGQGGEAESSTTFVARNSVWDPFIIWVVNTHLSQPEIDAFNARIGENRTPIAGYPTPPTFAMLPQCPPDFDAPDAGEGGHMDGDANGVRIPIMYNQPVILQCVSTGMCSPVLTLRKVEKGSIATGSFYGRDPSRDVMGDPVSQLHKVAFEVRVQSRDELPVVTVTPAGLHAHAASYLTCMGDVVGLNKTCEGRQITSDGSSGGKLSAARGSPARKQSKDTASVGTSSWAEDVGDNAVWTMVGTDCAIYRFDYPPAADVLSQLRQLGTTASALPARDMALDAPPSSATAPPQPLTGSLALPPTPTSPRGLHEYLNGTHHHHHHQPHGHYSFDMLFSSSESDPAIAAAAAAAMGPGMGVSGGFQPGSLEASFAVSVCGMGIPGIGDSLSPHLVSMPHQQQSAGSSAIFGSLAGSQPADGSRATPVVFRSTVQQQQQQAVASAATMDGGRASITLHGTNFTPDMVVMFDGQRSLYTEVRSSECIVCIGPLGSEVASAGGSEAGGSASDADTEQHQAAGPTSPSASDASGDDGGLFGTLDAAARIHRASSADSTASSATATHSSRGAPGSKGAGGAVKVDIRLACNNGAGPTFKTGQSYTVALH